jgi:transposase InsO family protein
MALEAQNSFYSDTPSTP